MICVPSQYLALGPTVIGKSPPQHFYQKTKLFDLKNVIVFFCNALLFSFIVLTNAGAFSKQLMIP